MVFKKIFVKCRQLVCSHVVEIKYLTISKHLNVVLHTREQF